MSFRRWLLLGLLIILSIILYFIPRDGFKNLDTSAAAPIIENPPIVYPPRNVSPGGPSTANQLPYDNEPHAVSPEVAMDPYSQNEESASIPERLRHPERMFKPAPDNSTVGIAAASGVASASASQASHALQAFTPEFAQNGGEFMQGIFANDTSEPGGYSEF